MAFLAALPMMAIGGAGAAAGGLGGIGTLFSAFSAVAGIAGSAVAAQGSIAAGKSQQQMAMMNANAMENQAKQFENRGKYERAQYGVKRDAAVRKRKVLQARAQTVGAGGGFMADDHSSSIAIADLQRYGDFEALSYGSAGEAAQYDNKILASNKMAEAQLARFEGNAAMASAKRRAMGTMIGGLGPALGKFNPDFGGSVGGSATAGRTQVASAAIPSSPGPSPYFYGKG